MNRRTGQGKEQADGEARELIRGWAREWPRTDFSKHAVDLREILSGGSPKDGIPAIDHPRFVSVDKARGLGRDVGNVTVRRRTDVGLGEGLEDVVYDVSFAFAFTAFHPEGVMHLE